MEGDAFRRQGSPPVCKQVCRFLQRVEKMDSEELEKMAGDWLSVNFLTVTNDSVYSSAYQTPYYDAKELDLNGLKTDKSGNKILPKGYITYSVHKGILLVKDENDYTLLDKEVVLIQKDELLYEQNMDNSTEFNR